jgi:hypothetical protein
MRRIESALLALALVSCGGNDNPVTPPSVAVHVVSGDKQSAYAGEQLPLPLEVVVVGSTGGGMPDARVDWVVIGGDGTLTQTATATNTAGHASVSWILGSTSGTQSVNATVNGVGTPATFTASASAPPVKITIEYGQNASAYVGQGVGLAILVKNLDGSSIANEPVEWVTNDGGSIVPDLYAHTDYVGWASAAWKLGPTVGTETAKAVLPRFGVSVTFIATAKALPPPPPPGTPQPAILHYDGTSWSIALQGTSTAPVLLNSVWGASPSAVFAVGSQCGVDLVLRYDGSAWTQPPATCVYHALNDLASLWGNSASDVFAIDRQRLPPWEGTSIRHFDGQSWTTQYNHSCSFCDPHLNAVWSSAPNYATAVGDSGLIVHYDGSAWTPQTSGTTQHLEALWGIASGASATIFAVGGGGTILSFDGTSWHAQTSGTTQALYGIWGTSSSDVFAVGGGGTILHYDGTAWTAQNSGSTKTLRGVWGSSATSVFAVGDASTILRYDGSSWTSQSAGASIELRGVWGNSPTNLFAVGEPKF